MTNDYNIITGIKVIQKGLRTINRSAIDLAERLIVVQFSFECAPYGNLNLSNLRSIHHLLQDVYEWAGTNAAR